MSTDRTLHPEAAAVLDTIEAAQLPPTHEVTVEHARDRLRRQFATIDEEPVGDVQDVTIAGPDGDALPLRIYRPEAEGPHPTVVWFHGGGYVLGDLETADATCRAICTAAEAMVVSVDYRLAPEHPFPAGLEDCYAATAWTARNAEDLGVAPGTLAVGGTSAGATLSAGVTLMARDRAAVGESSPDIEFAWLVYPSSNVRESFPAYEENGEGYFLERADSAWFRERYYATSVDRFHPYAAPLEARDLSGLPPATVVTAEFDPLRDDGLALADRLEADGVSVTRRHYDGMIHGFFSMLQLSTASECIGAVSDDYRSTVLAEGVAQ